MKKLICLVLLVCFYLPVLGEKRPYTEKEVTDILQELIDCEDRAKFLSKQYAESMAANLEMQLVISELKMGLEAEKEIDRIARYAFLVPGIWGIITFGTTGSMYSLLTGSLFLWVAIQ